LNSANADVTFAADSARKTASQVKGSACAALFAAQLRNLYNLTGEPNVVKETLKTRRP
jgi:hypothetical protein